MYNGIPIPHGALFVKKDTFLEMGMYDLAYQINADYDFILRLIKNEKRGFYLQIPLAQYRDGGASSGVQTFMERRKLLKKHGVSFLKRNSIVWFATIKLTLMKLLPVHLGVSVKKAYSFLKMNKQIKEE